MHGMNKCLYLTWTQTTEVTNSGTRGEHSVEPKKLGTRLDVVAHTCIPSTLEAKAGGSPEVVSSRPAWPTWWNPVFKINKQIEKISQVWWQMPVIPATQEAEAGESLEPRRWSLQWAEIKTLPFCTINSTRLCLTKKKKKKHNTTHYKKCCLKESRYIFK